MKLLGITDASDEPITYARILDVLGLDDALWCCRAEPDLEPLWRRYAVWCARQVQHLMTDPRSLDALDVAERHVTGQASDEELAAAREAAWAAARAAAREAAREAAWAAAREAAREAAWEAAWEAARAAAWGAARAAAWAAARAAAWAAAWEAAWEAARAAQAAAFRQLVVTGDLPELQLEGVANA